jgi:hypothetical protein
LLWRIGSVSARDLHANHEAVLLLLIAWYLLSSNGNWPLPVGPRTPDTPHFPAHPLSDHKVTLLLSTGTKTHTVPFLPSSHFPTHTHCIKGIASRGFVTWRITLPSVSTWKKKNIWFYTLTQWVFAIHAHEALDVPSESQKKKGKVTLGRQWWY